MSKSNETGQDEEDTQHGRYLTFALEKEVYGIEIKYVTEIIEMQPIVSMPEEPLFVKGIINLRGKIIPVIDVRLRFGMEPMEYNDRTCIIVVEIKNISIGLIVDNVSEVLAIPDEHITPPPEFQSGQSCRYILGIGITGKNVELLLDIQKLLNSEEFQEIRQLR